MKNVSYIKLFEALQKKAKLKQQVFKKTEKAFLLIQQAIEDMSAQFNTFLKQQNYSPVPFKAKKRGDFELELQFGGDILLFLMHTNVFEMPRDHEVMQTLYVKEQTDRSYCGIINIYNFLSDSFKYNRINDIGYLIGRIFINKDEHYFIEGKRALGFLYNNFGKHIINADSVNEIIEGSIAYTVNFDLLTPPYDQVKEVSVNEMKSTLDTIGLKTGKRLGFKFYQDKQTFE